MIRPWKLERQYEPPTGFWMVEESFVDERAANAALEVSQEREPDEKFRVVNRVR